MFSSRRIILILCALVAGVGGADNCVDSLPKDAKGYCAQITYEKTIVPGVGVQRITYCPCPEIVEQKIEKLEKRVADLADIEDSIRFLIEAHLAQLEIVTKIEKRVAELEQIQEATGFPKGSIILEKTTDSTFFDQILKEGAIPAYTRVEEPTINPHPFGTEPDSHDKPLPDNVCPKCGKNMVKESDGLVLTSNPPQYPWHWKCGCGHVGKAGVDRGLTQDQMFMNQWNAVNP